MKWTTLWFKNQLREWKALLKRSVEENKAGHIAYAEKQVAMWKMFMREGERASGKIYFDNLGNLAVASGNYREIIIIAHFLTPHNLAIIYL